MTETTAQVLAETKTHALVLVQRNAEAPPGWPKGQLCVVVPTDAWTGDTVGAPGVSDEVVADLVKRHARAQNQFFGELGVGDSLKVGDDGVLSITPPRGILPA